MVYIVYSVNINSYTGVSKCNSHTTTVCSAEKLSQRESDMLMNNPLQATCQQSKGKTGLEIKSKSCKAKMRKLAVLYVCVIS